MCAGSSRRFPSSAAWIFDGTNLQSGDTFSLGGIEIDARAAASPRGTKVLATIPDVFGPGMTAEMTYYETPQGAKVFAAGAFSLAAAIWHAPVQDYAGSPDGAAPWADVDPPAAIPPPVAGAEGPHTRPGWLTAGRPDDAA